MPDYINEIQLKKNPLIPKVGFVDIMKFNENSIQLVDEGKFIVSEAVTEKQFSTPEDMMERERTVQKVAYQSYSFSITAGQTANIKNLLFADELLIKTNTSDFPAFIIDKEFDEEVFFEKATIKKLKITIRKQDENSLTIANYLESNYVLSLSPNFDYVSPAPYGIASELDYVSKQKLNSITFRYLGTNDGFLSSLAPITFYTKLNPIPIYEVEKVKDNEERLNNGTLERYWDLGFFTMQFFFYLDNVKLTNLVGVRYTDLQLFDLFSRQCTVGINDAHGIFVSNYLGEDFNPVELLGVEQEENNNLKKVQRRVVNVRYKKHINTLLP